MRGRLCALLSIAGLLVVSACASAATPTVLPTQALPPTLAPTLPPASTDDGSLSAPADLITPTSPETGLLIPAAAQPLVQHAIDDLSQRLKVDAALIQIARLESVSWNSPDLGCAAATEDAPSTPIDGYRIVLSEADQLYEYHSDTTNVRACAEGVTAEATVESLLVADPVAAELIALAKRQVVRTHSAAEADVKLIDVASVTWPDTALGCPQPNTSYTAGSHDGYRIVVAAGTTQYIYHTDFDHVVECAAADEVLPANAVIATAQATP